MATADTARLLATLGLDTRGFSRGVRSALGETTKLQKGLGGVGRASRGIGKAAGLIGGAVVAGLAGSAKAAIDFQDAFQGVVKTVDAGDLAKAGLTFDDLSDSIRKMSREMPISAIDLAHIAESAGALGVKAGDIESFTKQVAILSTTTNVSADDAATALGQLQNVIGLTGAEFDNFAASLVDLGNKGASTESDILEIARRSGGAAKLFGIAKDATLGWSAAAANLGLNQELAGTSLQNLFLKAMPAFQKGSKTLRKVTGETALQLRKSFKKDAGGALEDFLRKLGKLPKDARLDAVHRIFGKGSGLTRLILGLSDSVNKNLDPALKDSVASWKAATAAQAEFDKRNATVRSAITRLKNNVIDAAVSIGEGFAPAIGRAADKLSAFLSNKDNRTQLQDIGKRIGDALDKIDWDKALNAAKSVAAAFGPALDVLGKIASLVAGLPPGVLGAGAGLVITDKVTGGAVSSAIGGAIGGLGATLAKTLAAKIPLFGSAFVQPVFVTNLGAGLPGGGLPGGAGPAGGKTGLLGKAGKVLAGVTIVVGAAEIADAIHGPLQGVAEDIHKQFLSSIPDIGLNDLSWPFGPKDTPTILPDVFGGNGLLGGRGAPPAQPVDRRNPGEILAGNVGKDMSKVNENTANTYRATLDAKVATMTAGDAIRNATSTSGESIRAATALGARDVSSTTRSGTTGTTASVNSASARIAGAIAASRPIVTTNVDVHVTAASVTKATTTSTRYGNSNGSAGGGGGNPGKKLE